MRHLCAISDEGPLGQSLEDYCDNFSLALPAPLTKTKRWRRLLFRHRAFKLGFFDGSFFSDSFFRRLC
jgi:hypothetical protein